MIPGARRARRTYGELRFDVREPRAQVAVVAAQLLDLAAQGAPGLGKAGAGSDGFRGLAGRPLQAAIDVRRLDPVERR